MLAELKRPSPAALLAKLKTGDKPTLRVYIGAAPGVGKTWQMLEDAHLLKRERVDIVIAVLETHGRFETAALADGIERLSMRQIDYRGVTLEEMDIEAVIARDPQVAIVDELAHTDIPGSKNRKRYEDVLELLDHDISVITAVNIQHIESLNDVVARTTGVRVRPEAASSRRSALASSSSPANGSSPSLTLARITCGHSRPLAACSVDSVTTF